MNEMNTGIEAIDKLTVLEKAVYGGTQFSTRRGLINVSQLVQLPVKPPHPADLSLVEIKQTYLNLTGNTSKITDVTDIGHLTNYYVNLFALEVIGYVIRLKTSIEEEMKQKATTKE